MHRREGSSEVNGIAFDQENRLCGASKVYEGVKVICHPEERSDEGSMSCDVFRVTIGGTYRFKDSS